MSSSLEPSIQQVPCLQQQLHNSSTTAVDSRTPESLFSLRTAEPSSTRVDSPASTSSRLLEVSCGCERLQHSPQPSSSSSSSSVFWRLYSSYRRHPIDYHHHSHQLSSKNSTSSVDWRLYSSYRRHHSNNHRIYCCFCFSRGSTASSEREPSTLLAISFSTLSSASAIECGCSRRLHSLNLSTPLQWISSGLQCHHCSESSVSSASRS